MKKDGQIAVGHRHDIPGRGAVRLVSKGEMAVHECRCGQPDCDGTIAEFDPSCDCAAGFTAMYYKSEGLMVISCAECGVALAFRLAND